MQGLFFELYPGICLNTEETTRCQSRSRQNILDTIHYGRVPTGCLNGPADFTRSYFRPQSNLLAVGIHNYFPSCRNKRFSAQDASRNSRLVL